ncbi:MAG: DDE-type integrase/transposase/recombinase [Bacillota bacterium]
MEKLKNDALRETALERFSWIAPLLDENMSSSWRKHAHFSTLLSSGLSERTIRRYVSAYKKGGFEALYPKERKDKGLPKTISPDVLKEAEVLRRELPERSVESVISILESEKKIAFGEVARSTLDRHLRKAGATRKAITASKGTVGRRFVREGRNTLWQSDLKYGPWIPDPKNPKKPLRTYLLVIIDDATRMICHSQFYISQKLPTLEDCLKKAILKCGIPDAIYVDNGKIFVSTWIKLACARLNIRHIHTAPYAPEAKGKVERFNRTVESFINEVNLEKPKTIDELNFLYRHWLQEGYLHKVHGELNGKSPAQAFQEDAKHIKYPSPEALKDAFLWEKTLTVDKTGCVILSKVLFEVGLEFIRKKVDLHYDPFDLSAVDVYYAGQKKKTIAPAKIGEYRTGSTMPETKPSQVSESRLLKAYKNKSDERIRKAGAINFGKGGLKNV